MRKSQSGEDPEVKAFRERKQQIQKLLDRDEFAYLAEVWWWGLYFGTS